MQTERTYPSLIVIWRDRLINCGDVVASSSSSPFISDLFFLLQAYQHLGINKTLDNRTKSDKKVRDYKKHVKKLETEKGALPADVREVVSTKSTACYQEG